MPLLPHEKDELDARICKHCRVSKANIIKLVEHSCLHEECAHVVFNDDTQLWVPYTSEVWKELDFQLTTQWLIALDYRCELDRKHQPEALAESIGRVGNALASLHFTKSERSEADPQSAFPCMKPGDERRASAFDKQLRQSHLAIAVNRS